MDYEMEKKSNVGKIAGLFIIFLVLGIVMNYFYIVFQDNAMYDMLAVAITVGLTFLLAVIVYVCKRVMVITNRAAAFVWVLIALLIMYYLNWNMFFALWYSRDYGYNTRAFFDFFILMEWTRWVITSPANPVAEFVSDIRYFNSTGTWSWGDGAVWTGTRLAIVWIVEFLIIFVPPLFVAAIDPGVYLPSRNVFADPKQLDYAFEEFDDTELSRINDGYIDTIIEKPLATDRNRMNAVALCIVGEEPTEYIAVYKAQFNGKTGELELGGRRSTVMLTMEKIDELKRGLENKHRPVEVKEPEQSSDTSPEEPSADPLEKPPEENNSDYNF